LRGYALVFGAVVRSRGTLDQGSIVICKVMLNAVLSPQSEELFEQALFEQLFEQSADASLVAENGIFTKCNKVAVEMLGCQSKRELLALRPDQISPEYQPDGRLSSEKAEEMIALALQRGSHRFEWVHQRIDSEPFWVEVNAVRIEIGQRQCLYATWQDIAERKTAEAARAQTELNLKVSEQRFRDVTEAAGEYIWEITADGIYTFVTERAKDVKGYGPDELLGHTPFEFMPSEDVGRVEAIVQTAAVQKSAFTLEHRDILPNGEVVWESVSGLPILDTAGDIIGFRGTGLSITERKQAEEALRQKMQRERLLNRMNAQIRSSLDFNTILTTAVESVRHCLQVDSCTFIWYRPQTEEALWEIVKQSCEVDFPSLLGNYPADAIGSVATRLLDLEVLRINDVSEVDDPIAVAFLTQAGLKASLNLPVPVGDDLIGVLSCQHRTPYAWDDDDVALLRQVTEQLVIALNQAELYNQSQSKAQALEKAMQELQRAQIRMIQAEKMSSLGQLVAGVAHEINNPVSFIYGNVSPANTYTQDLLNLIGLYQTHYPQPHPSIQEEIEAIDLEFLRADLPQLLASMKMGAERIRQIVSSLRTFSRLDESACKEVDLHEGLDSTLVILENRLRATSERPAIQVLKHYGDLPLVECYAGQINQVFMNLISNALDAMESRHGSFTDEQSILNTLEICTYITEDQQRVAICIKDNGIGIADNVKQRMFDPFFTTKPIGKGTGMGLSISYQIITENHGGSLTCFSTPGEGTEWAIEVPLKLAIAH
jgi:PAS domain S-box-containing protein